jgi:chromosome partitioning protein
VVLTLLTNTAIKPKRIVIANAKGGCGKTTIATNLAAYLANRNKNTVLLDLDNQASSMLWIKNRARKTPIITGIIPHKNAEHTATRTWQMRLPPGTHFLIIDTPGGLNGFALSDMIYAADLVIVPVLASAIDMDAAEKFISTLKKLTQNVMPKVNIAVIANRTRRGSKSFNLLYQFLTSSGVPYIGTLRDTQNYAKAAQSGLGIHELQTAGVEKDITQWQSIISWLQPMEFAAPQKKIDLSAEARVVNCA